MESVYLLIPVSVLLVFGIAIAFWWSVRSGQFDDLEGPAFRVLMDDQLRRSLLLRWKEPTKQRKFDLSQREIMVHTAIILSHCKADVLREFSVGVGVRCDAPFFCPLVCRVWCSDLGNSD